MRRSGVAAAQCSALVCTIKARMRGRTLLRLHTSCWLHHYCFNMLRQTLASGLPEPLARGWQRSRRLANPTVMRIVRDVSPPRGSERCGTPAAGGLCRCASLALGEGPQYACWLLVRARGACTAAGAQPGYSAACMHACRQTRRAAPKTLPSMAPWPTSAHPGALRLQLARTARLRGLHLRSRGWSLCCLVMRACLRGRRALRACIGCPSSCHCVARTGAMRRSPCLPPVLCCLPVLYSNAPAHSPVGGAAHALMLACA